MLKLSSFCIHTPTANGGVLLKSTYTGASLWFPEQSWQEFQKWLTEEKSSEDGIFPFDELLEDGLLVDSEFDEFSEWSKNLLSTRNDRAHVFTLHFEPTIMCQFECHYCFENGADRGKPMRMEVVTRSVQWFSEYLDANPEVDSLRLKFFGGEPLLNKGVITQALEGFKDLCFNRHIDFWVEITTNGELLDEKTAELFSRYNWKRVQITLDGPKEIHDARRHGKNKRLTYENIMRNIDMLLATQYVEKVDIRMTLDCGTKDHLGRLIDELAEKGKQSRISLSLGLTTPSLTVVPGRMTQEELATAAIEIWGHAQDRGFKIPEEFIAGPLCVAVAKHSAVLQPDGNLQKCFCTSGRKEFNFATIDVKPTSYAKDPRFEHWKRMDECVAERCSYLPICGGGCTFDAIVAQGGEKGSSKRFCQKTLLKRMNKGLLGLFYSVS